MTQFSLALGLGLASIAILGAFGASGAGPRADASQRIIRALKTNTPIPLDADLRKWHGAESVSIEGQPLGGHPRRASVYALWDAKNLYLAFDVHSCKLRATVREHDGDKLWEDDGVEFLIDAHRDRSKEFLPDDFSYHINILNAVYDDRGTPSGQPDEKWNGTAQHIVKTLDDYHYITEVAVPWKEIGMEPREDKTVIGIDFCVNGKDPATGEYVYYDWCGLKVFHDPSGFGELVLVGPRGH
jgi:hypothetical protein